MNVPINNLIKENNVYAIILAAGESKRLGTPKQLLEYKKKPLIVTICEQVESVFQDQFRIILGANLQQITPTLDSFGKYILENNDWQEGMASSIRVGIQSLPETAKAVMIVLVDQALITDQELAMLLLTYLQHPESIITSQYDGIDGVPAIFPRDNFSKLLKLCGDKGAKQFLQQQENTISVSIPEASLDIDTLNDYKKLLTLSTES